ncbi:hypothetical protein JQK87_09865 [Streptomyces sp. G44]|nr:hypothetical protein [Streptomyces sp. G44]
MCRAAPSSGPAAGSGPRCSDDHPRPLPSRGYAELVDGLMDGLLLDITGWTADKIESGVALMSELGQFGAGGRTLCDPPPGRRSR